MWKDISQLAILPPNFAAQRVAMAANKFLHLPMALTVRKIIILRNQKMYLKFTG